MTTDITELAQSLKAAAEKATPGNWRAFQYHDGQCGVGGGNHDEIMVCEHISKKRPHDALFIALANPANILALVEALEKAQQRIDELQQGFIANQEEAHEAIKYATELKEQLARACAGREDAFREVDEMQKSLDHTHRRRAIWRGRAVTAEAEIASLRQRIAELESSSVKLPKPYAYLRENDGQIQISIGSERPSDRSGGYATPWFAIYTAAGIKVEAE
ncbi:TPA: ead/Ea22-like family protein [Klebsiella quasipneumoniae]|nr:ead/Ea22-like family protein [Klebsiella quasipneumoniae]